MRLKNLLLICLFLTSCNTIEHRSEQPIKKQLVSLTNSVNTTIIWEKKVVNLKPEDVVNSALLVSKNSKQLFTADFLGNIVATDLEGNNLWRRSIKEPITAGPSVFKNKVCVTTATAKLICLSIDNGEILWNSVISSEAVAPLGFSSDPMFDLVFVHTIDGGLSAINLLDGRQVWRYSTIVPNIALRRGSAPVLSNNYVVTGFANGKLLAINKEEGSVIWSHNLSNPKGRIDLQRMIDISADPVIYDNVAYAVSYQGNIVSVELNDGSLLWEREISSYSGLTVDKKGLYVASVDGRVFALNNVTGSTIWVQEDLVGHNLSKPVIINNYILLTDLDGYIHFLDKHSGKIKARILVDNKGVSITPVVDLMHKILYVLTNSGRLLAIKYVTNN